MDENWVRIEFIRAARAAGLVGQTAPKVLRHQFATALQEGSLESALRTAPRAFPSPIPEIAGAAERNGALLPALEALQTVGKTAESFRPGDPFGGDANLGPLASAAQLERVRGYIKKGVDEGAKLLTGGTDLPEGIEKGYFVRPTVFSGVRPDMTIAQEEIFGPVLSIIPYDDEDDAVRIANDSVYGLSGGVWSGDPERAKKVAKRMRTGQVDINGGSFNPMAPFGGYKQSGNGRELGKYGLEEYLETKSLQL